MTKQFSLDQTAETCQWDRSCVRKQLLFSLEHWLKVSVIYCSL